MLQTCLESWPTPDNGDIYFVVANLVMCYLVPLLLISACYYLIWRRVCGRQLPGEVQLYQELIIHRSKVKVIKMLLIVIILFACSWLPLYVIFTRVKLGGDITPGFEETLIYFFLPIAQWLGSSNSCINPVLYAYFNKKFRAGFKAIISSKSCCSPIRYDCSFDGRNLSSKEMILCNSNVGPVRRSITRMTITPTNGLKTTRVGGSEGNLVRTKTLSFKNLNRINNNSNDGPYFTKGQLNGMASSDIALHTNATFV